MRRLLRLIRRAIAWRSLSTAIWVDSFDILPALKSGDSLYRRHMSVPGKDI